MNIIRKIKRKIFNILLSFIPTQKADAADFSIGICASIPHRYVDMFIYTIHSFFYFTKMSMQVYIVNDPNDPDGLSENDLKKLQKHFTVILDFDTTLKMKDVILKYKYLYNYRFNINKTPSRFKYDALLLNPFKKFILIDSDILFFDTPNEIINFLKNEKQKIRYFSRVNNAQKMFPFLKNNELSLRLMIAKSLSRKNNSIDHFFTFGLTCVPHKKCINLKTLDEILKLFYQIHCAGDWLTEERAIGALLCNKISKKLPPQLYYTATRWEQYKKINFSKVIAVHYQDIQGLKNKYITDALLQMIKTRLFTK